MAKKHQYRASAAEKKKRAAEAQRRQTKAFFEKYSKHLIIAAIALAVIIAAAVIVSNSLYYKGSLAVKDGKVEGYQENWLVKNMGSLSKPKYFKMGEVDLPQGYKSMGALVSDKTEQNFFFAAEDPAAPISQYTVLVMKNSNAKADAAVNSDNTNYMNGEFNVHNAQIAGHDVHLRMGICENYNADAEGNFVDFLGYYRFFTAYVNTRDNCTIKVPGFTPDYPTLEEMPTDEEMIASLEPVFAAIRTAE